MSNIFSTLPGFPTILDDLYEGYYWYSHQQKPDTFENKKIDPDKFTPLPFVIEANFYEVKGKRSIQVRYLDGQYEVTLYQLDPLPEGICISLKTYISHDLARPKYKMIEAWESIKNESLENLQTWSPAWSAFAGFVKPQTQNKES